MTNQTKIPKKDGIPTLTAIPLNLVLYSLNYCRVAMALQVMAVKTPPITTSSEWASNANSKMQRYQLMLREPHLKFSR